MSSIKRGRDDPDAVHYAPLGATETACGKRISTLHARSCIEAKDTTCIWCLTSDEYAAQKLEEALLGSEVRLVDDVGNIHATWRKGAEIRSFNALNNTKGARIFRLMRNTTVLVEVMVAPGNSLLWTAADPRDVIVV